MQEMAFGRGLQALSLFGAGQCLRAVALAQEVTSLLAQPVSVGGEEHQGSQIGAAPRTGDRTTKAGATNRTRGCRPPVAVHTRPSMKNISSRMLSRACRRAGASRPSIADSMV